MRRAVKEVHWQRIAEYQKGTLSSRMQCYESQWYDRSRKIANRGSIRLLHRCFHTIIHYLCISSGPDVRFQKSSVQYAKT